MIDVISIFQTVFPLGLSTFLLIAIVVMFVNLAWDFIRNI